MMSGRQGKRLALILRFSHLTTNIDGVRIVFHSSDNTSVETFGSRSPYCIVILLFFRLRSRWWWYFTKNEFLLTSPPTHSHIPSFSLTFIPTSWNLMLGRTCSQNEILPPETGSWSSNETVWYVSLFFVSSTHVATDAALMKKLVSHKKTRAYMCRCVSRRNKNFFLKKRNKSFLFDFEESSNGSKRLTSKNMKHNIRTNKARISMNLGGTMAACRRVLLFCHRDMGPSLPRQLTTLCGPEACPGYVWNALKMGKTRRPGRTAMAHRQMCHFSCLHEPEGPTTDGRPRPPQPESPSPCLHPPSRTRGCAEQKEEGAERRSRTKKKASNEVKRSPLPPHPPSLSGRTPFSWTRRSKYFLFWPQYFWKSTVKLPVTMKLLKF